MIVYMYMESDSLIRIFSYIDSQLGHGGVRISVNSNCMGNVPKYDWHYSKVGSSQILL